MQHIIKLIDTIKGLKALILEVHNWVHYFK